MVLLVGWISMEATPVEHTPPSPTVKPSVVKLGEHQPRLDLQRHSNPTTTTAGAAVKAVVSSSSSSLSPSLSPHLKK